MHFWYRFVSTYVAPKYIYNSNNANEIEKNLPK